MKNLQFNAYQCGVGRVGSKKFKSIPASPCDAGLKSHPTPTPPPLRGEAKLPSLSHGGGILL